MSRNPQSPPLVGLPGGPPLVGSPPQPVAIVAQNPDGSKVQFPVVALHLLTNEGAQMLSALMQSAVQDALREAGMLPAAPQPPASDEAEGFPVCGK